MSELQDPREFAEMVIDALGGPEAARRITDAEHDKFTNLWSRPDVDAVGRVLRAHLFLEHHIAHALQAANPRLGSVRDARLTFATKVRLLDRSNAVIDDLIPAILHVNKVRNRIAHDLKATLFERDAEIVQRPKMYAAMRRALEKPETRDPVVAIEALSQYAGAALRSETSELSKAVASVVAVKAGHVNLERAASGSSRT